MVGHVVKASALMVGLSAVVAGAIAFYPHSAPSDKAAPAAREAAPIASLPVGQLAPLSRSLARDVPPQVAAAPTPKPANSQISQANQRLAAAMEKPARQDGLSQIAQAAGAPSDQSALGRPTGASAALAFAPTASESNADLIARAKTQLRDGAAASARLLLKRAARGGSPEALALLGQSFDAAALSEMGVKGVQADASEARKYYKQASDAGSADAKRRLAKLGG
jgi:hypothetical protein